MTDVFKQAVSSRSIFIELVDSTTGLPKTGILHSDVTGSYVRTRSARVAITMATLASASTAYSSGGFILIDDTNQPGVYRFDVPDLAFATGVEAVVVTVKATGCRTVSRLFDLVDNNNQVASLPNVAAGGIGGLLTAPTIANTGLAVTTVTTLTNLPSITANWLTAAGLAADAVTEIQTGLASQTSVDALGGAAAVTVERSITDTKSITFAWPVSGATIIGTRSIDNAIPYTAVSGAIAFLRTETGKHYYTLAHNAADRPSAEGQVRYAFVDGTYTRYVVLRTATSGLDASTRVKLDATQPDYAPATAAALATVQSDTNDIQTRLPAALESGRIAAVLDSATATQIDNIEATLTTLGSESTTVERSVSDTNAITFSWPVSGATITGTASLNNGTYGAVAGAIAFLRTETGRHYYTLAYNAADRPSAEGQVRYKFVDGTYTGYVVLRTVNLVTVAQVNAQVLDVLSVDTFGELGSPPAATSSLKDKLVWLFMWARNKSTATATERKLYADDVTTIVSTETITDNGTTFTKGESL